MSCIVIFGIECSGFLEWLSGRVDCCKPVVKFYPKGTLRSRAMRRTHGKREGETEFIKQLNFMFL